MDEYTITIVLETDKDTLEDILTILNNMLPYIADNLLITSKKEDRDE